MTIEVMKQALKAFEDIAEAHGDWTNGMWAANKALNIIPLLRQAIDLDVKKPLTDEQIWDVYIKAPVDIDCHVSDLNKFARAIEAAHGIKEHT